MLLSRNRLFGRRPPSKDAKIIYIYCEGRDREYWYFQYFREMDSRIHLEVYPLDSQEDNSPLGLLRIAERDLVMSEDNPVPKFGLQEQDEVWIVLDSDPDRDDSRRPQIAAVREAVGVRLHWDLVESNPCFEVWLYYHGREEVEEFDGKESPRPWKTLLNDVFKGGFDTRKHPIYIQDAKRRSEAKCEFGEDARPKVGSTEMHRLAESILNLLGDTIREGRAKLP